MEEKKTLDALAEMEILIDTLVASESCPLNKTIHNETLN